MKYSTYKLLLILIIPLIISCVDESSDVGGKWVDSSFRNVLVDTCTVQLSTILTDSITTSGDTITQIGRYSDDYRGAIHSGFFTEYNTASTTFHPDKRYVFDSITIALTPSGDIIGDTLSSLQNASIYRLTENLELTSDNYLYNTSSFKYNETPLTTFSYRPRPKSKEQFEVRLPDTFGEEFFELIEKQSIFLDSQERFRQYFPGLTILPDDNGSCITGFAVNDTSMCLKIYYREIHTSTVERTLTFTPNSTYCFTQASQDFNNTPFQGILPGTHDAMPSDKSQHMSYLQGLSGVYTKLEFPYLNNLRSEGDMITIESAMLYLYPVQGTYGDDIPLPESLTLYTADENDVAQGVITDSSGEEVQTGNLVTDDVHAIYYSFDLTSFMQSNLGTIGMNRQNLMLMLPNEKFLSTPEGLILGDSYHEKNNIKLRILFKVYN